jgi:putative intracellular protease/amidase
MNGGMKPQRKIAILVFDDVELLDIAGPHDVFATAAALDPGPPSPYEVVTVAPGAGMNVIGLPAVPDFVMLTLSG